MGALLSARFRFEPVLWLGYLAVLLTHQFGHAVFVKSVRGSVVGLDITALGGHCRWQGPMSLLERAWVAWGGAFAQAALLGSTWLLWAIFGAPTSPLGTQLGYSFVEVNLAILAINLLPFPPLDGALAWRLFGELRAAGGTFRGALLGPLWRWARRRRQLRGKLDGAGAPEEQAAAPPPSAPAEPPYARAHTADGRSEGYAEPAAGGDADPDDPLVDPQPSAEAQRELAALLRRIGDEASRARRRR